MERLNNYYWNIKSQKTQVKEEMDTVQNENIKYLKELRLKILKEYQRFISRLKDKGKIKITSKFVQVVLRNLIFISV